MNVETKVRGVPAGYDEDVVAWANAQAALLRARQFDAIDLANIVEEIEDLARGQRAALGSQIGRIIDHLLKLQFSPAVEPRRGWIDSVVQARGEIDTIIDSSPSLGREISDLVARQFAKSSTRTAKTLDLWQEPSAADAIRSRAQPYTPEQILGDWFPGG